MEGKGAGKRGRFQGKAKKLQRREQVETLLKEHVRKAKLTIFEDETCVAHTEVVKPQAPVHIVIQAKSSSSEYNEAVLGRLLVVARKLANKEGLDEEGYRVVMNADNIVHVLGGRQMNWPPG